MKAAAVTGAQTRLSIEAKPLKVAKIVDQLSTVSEKLIQLQEKVSTLFKYMKKEGLLVRNEKETSHVKRKEQYESLKNKIASLQNQYVGV